MRPYPAEKMRSWGVDERVGNVRNDDPELLTERPTQPTQQQLF
jgi:putative SOS response-associated peptidase YedK